MSIICRACGHANADGAQFCANPDCGEFLGWQGVDPPGQGAGGGPYTGRFPVPGGTPPPGGVPPSGGPRPGGVPPSATPPPGGGDQRAGIRASLADPVVDVTPGSTASTVLSVYNSGTRVEGLAARVDGPAATWTAVEPAELSVYPEQTGTVTLRFAPPRAASCPAGHAWYVVRLDSTIHPGLSVTVNGAAAVASYHEVAAELVPPSASGRGATRHQVVIDNRGNVVERAHLSASDDEGAFRMELGRTATDLPPGKVGIPLAVRAPRRWFGHPRTVPIHATVAVEGANAPLRADGTRHVVPVFPSWAPLVALATVLLLGGGGAAIALTGGEEKPPVAGPTSPVQPAPGPPTTAGPSPKQSLTPPVQSSSASKPATSTPATSTPPPMPPATAVHLAPGLYKFRPRHSYPYNKCLGVENGSTAARAWVVQWTCLDVPSQELDLQELRPNVYRIRPRHSNLCVSAGAVGRGTDMFQDRCSSSRLDQQFWFDIAEVTSTGTAYRLRPMHSYGTVPAGMCIGVGASGLGNGVHVGQWDCQATNTDQHFYLLASGQPPSPGP